MKHSRAEMIPIHRRQFLRDSMLTMGGALCLPSAARSAADAGASEVLRAEIDIDVSKASHPIDAKIYGSFAEHIGRCIYGGIYDEGSPLSDEEGFRQDVMGALRDWGVPVLRWPGGNFVSGYRWMDGIGPKASRPRRENRAWFVEESNRFGTDEFISYCHKIGAEPYICVNLGTGTVEEAANWVEYCNGTGNTYYANLRRQNGHEQPYHVRYWGLGNEVYGEWQIGHKSAEDYAKIALEAGKLMKWSDPKIKLVACGADDPEWNRAVLEKLTLIADYISLHAYEGSPDYYETLGSVTRLEDRLRQLAALIEATDGLRTKSNPIFALSMPEIKNKTRIEIAVDEWNIWYRKWDIWRRDVPNPAEEIYNLRDALWVASVLNLFQRMGDIVTLANLAQMVNVIAPIMTSKEGMFLQPIYLVMKLYRQNCGSRYVPSQVRVPTFSSKTFKGVPYLDVASSTNEGRSFLAIAVVNRHETHPINAALHLRGYPAIKTASALTITGSSPWAENSFSTPNNVGIQKKSLPGTGEHFTYTFPAHSITLLRCE